MPERAHASDVSGTRRLWQAYRFSVHTPTTERVVAPSLSTAFAIGVWNGAQCQMLVNESPIRSISRTVGRALDKMLNSKTGGSRREQCDRLSALKSSNSSSTSCLEPPSDQQSTCGCYNYIIIGVPVWDRSMMKNRGGEETLCAIGIKS